MRIDARRAPLHAFHSRRFSIPNHEQPIDLALSGGAWGGTIARMLTVFCYQNCSTCREALRWLETRGIAHRVRAIRETPPSVADLRTMLKAHGGELRKLFNTSGNDYRELGLKDRLPTLTEAAALDLLHGNGNLVKRPFVIGDGVAMVGFKPEVWERTLAGRP